MLIKLRIKLIYLLSGLFVCLAFLSSAPTDPEARAGLADAGYNLFRRYAFGAISTWDILLLALLVLLFWCNSSSVNPVNLLSRVVNNKIVNLYFIIMMLAILVGMVVILTSQMDVFVPKDWFRAIVPIAYMFITYFLMVNIVRTPKQLQTIWNIFELIAFALILYGFIRLFGILTGSINTLSPGDIPIVLYSEMLYFDLPILVYCISVWSGKPLGIFRWISLICMIGFVLASTRRFNYIMLLVNIIIALIVARKSCLFSFRNVLARSRYLIVLVCVSLLAVIIILPTLFEGILFAIQTINMFSEVGFQYTGEFRLLQIENIFLNFTEYPMTWLSGFGIGSKWHAIKELPTTIDTVGSYMAFDANVVSVGGDWFPFFHVPFFSTFFRFGPLGMVCLIFIVRALYVDFTKYISTVTNRDHKIILCALASLVFMPVVVLGDSPSPISYILVGVNLGLIQGYRTLSSIRNHGGNNVTCEYR